MYVIASRDTKRHSRRSRMEGRNESEGVSWPRKKIIEIVKSIHCLGKKEEEETSKKVAWIRLSHAIIVGNEKADKTAKEAANSPTLDHYTNSLPPEFIRLSYETEKKTGTINGNPRVNLVANSNQKNESFKKTIARSLPRHDQVVISRIIIVKGHKNTKLTPQFVIRTKFNWQWNTWLSSAENTPWIYQHKHFPEWQSKAERERAISSLSWQGNQQTERVGLVHAKGNLNAVGRSMQWWG